MYKALFIFFIVWLRMIPAWAQTDWKLSTDKDGIKIYTSIVPESKIKAVKVECQFEGTLSQFVTLLLDVKSCPQWVYHTKSCSLVKQVAPNELYYYSEINLPWPLQNRDFVAHLTITQDPVTKIVTVDGPAIPGLVPEKTGIVRIGHSKGKWIITPVAGGIINVVYTLHVDPGGALPAWLINLFATEGPQQIFKKLKIQLQKPVYKNARLSFIVN
ncbi:START domain-containing protein [Mucilaginibacter sp.]|uniref:START domain-containing protein n=1 Tax=Mucilaginibacter sp. TaxID=1882438 RepID=UPI003D14BA88